MDLVHLLSAVTALVSVVVSATVSLVTIRMNREMAREKSVADLRCFEDRCNEQVTV
jgi:hypothetical protein